MATKAPRTIIVVDDDDGVRDSTRVLLESYGYATDGYESADHFLQKAPAREVDCLLVDVQMPGKTGLELLEDLRSRAIDVPVILMTANVERLGERAKQAGALFVLRKPFAEDALLEAIALAWAEKPSRD